MLGTYGYEFGKVCMIYDTTTSGPMGGGLDLTGLSTYTAQVYADETDPDGTQFYGNMYKFNEETGLWEEFGEYRYFPYASPSKFEIFPKYLAYSKLDGTGDDMRDYVPVLNPCAPFNGEATVAPEPTPGTE